MTDETFRALVVTEVEPKKFVRTIETRSTADLPSGDLLIRVHYSSLNYKDALSASGNRGVTRNYPHTPGIDAAGVVAASESGEFAVGDEVVVIGRQGREEISAIEIARKVGTLPYEVSCRIAARVPRLYA